MIWGEIDKFSIAKNLRVKKFKRGCASTTITYVIVIFPTAEGIINDNYHRLVSTFSGMSETHTITAHGNNYGLRANDMGNLVVTHPDESSEVHMYVICSLSCNDHTATKTLQKV